MLRDATPRPLYVRRDLVNVAEFKKWATAQGFDDLVDDPHVTIIYSRSAVDWMKMGEDWGATEITINPGGPRMLDRLGPDAVPVLLFSSSQLSWRHEHMKREGASFEYAEYQPHLSISYEPQLDIDLTELDAYQGKLVFGPEIFEAADEETLDSIADGFNAGQPRDQAGRFSGYGAVMGSFGAGAGAGVTGPVTTPPATTVEGGKADVARLTAELAAAKANLAGLRAAKKADSPAAAKKAAVEAQAKETSAKLETALGSPSFETQFQALRSQPAAMVIATARQFQAFKPTSKAAALSRIYNRHSEILASRRSIASVGGRSAA